MRRIAGTGLALFGILVVPPLWAETATGGLQSKLVFAAAFASIMMELGDLTEEARTRRRQPTLIRSERRL